MSERQKTIRIEGATYRNAVFEANKGDFIAREILTELADGTINDSTDSLATKIIFGKEKHPKLNYWNKGLSMVRI